MNLLIVDDQPEDRTLLRAQLEAVGHVVIEAADGAEALAALATRPVDAIVSDLLMPNVDGYRLCWEIRRDGRWQQLPVIIHSGTYDSVADRELARAVGADAFVLKPSPAEELLRLIAAARSAPAVRVTVPAPADEAIVLNRYNAALVAKLEERNLELAAANAQLRQLIEHGPAMVYSLRWDGDTWQPTFVSANVLLRLGYTVNETLAAGWWEAALHPEDAVAARTARAQLDAEGETAAEYRLRRKEGGYQWIKDVSRLLRDDAGRPREILGVWVDIDGHKRAEAARQVSDERFAKIFHAGPTAIGYSGMDGRLLEVNDCWLELFGYARHEVVGRTATELGLWADAAAHQTAIERLKNEGSLRNFEARFRRKSAGIRTALVSMEVLQLGDAPVVLAMLSDVTENKRLEAELYRALRVESVGRLATGIAHDMNNILAPIMMAASLLRAGLPPEEAERTLSTVETSAKRGADLVKQLLIYGRGVEGERGPVRPVDLIRDIAKIARETFPRSVALEMNFARDVWSVRGDVTQLHQVLLNLCVNARDAMPRGGALRLRVDNVEITEPVPAAQGEAKPGRYVRLTVSDTGQGIPPDVIDRIFDPFFSTKPVGDGTGLGLSTVLGIVKSHAGFLTLKTELGRGTTFEVFLPATPAEPTPIMPPPALPPRGAQEMILVVDDEDGIRRVLRDTLERHNYRVLTANDGAEAAVAFARHGGEVRLVITDIDMPFMDGVSLAHVLRKITPGVRFIVSSGVSGAEQPRLRSKDMETLGVRGVLPKPYTTEAVLRAVHAALHGDPSPGG